MKQSRIERDILCEASGKWNGPHLLLLTASMNARNADGFRSLSFQRDGVTSSLTAICTWKNTFLSFVVTLTTATTRPAFLLVKTSDCLHQRFYIAVISHGSSHSVLLLCLACSSFAIDRVFTLNVKGRFWHCGWTAFFLSPGRRKLAPPLF
jgi:hypothetical protein